MMGSRRSRMEESMALLPMKMQDNGSIAEQVFGRIGRSRQLDSEPSTGYVK